MKPTPTLKRTIAYFCFMLALLIAGCKTQTDPNEEQEKASDKHLHDSLVTTGTHGYYITYYIIGRLKMHQMDDIAMPFKIKVMSIDPELLEKNISFRILDADRYELKFEDDDKYEPTKGDFGIELKTKKTNALISKSDSLGLQSIDVLKRIDYSFKVHSY